MARRPHSFLNRSVAGFIHATYSLDRLYEKFDQARSAVVLAFASDALLEAHSNVYYGRMGERGLIRRGLFDWERSVISRFFPLAPARVLVGAAGLGREAIALAEMGYSVVAFEPVAQLVEEMAASLDASASVRVYSGAYRDLPYLDLLPAHSRADVRDEGPFDAAIIGWGSFPHLITDAERVETLRQFAEITPGPILVSFYGTFPESRNEPAPNWLRRWLRRRTARRGVSRFFIRSGYVRLLTSEDVARLAKEAGLAVLEVQCSREAQPYAVVSAARKA